MLASLAHRSCYLEQGQPKAVHALRGFRRRSVAGPRPRLGSRRAVSSVKEGEGAQDELYQGVYGTWRITNRDRVEVWSYRAGISAVAAAFAVGTAAALGPPDAAWVASGRQLGNWIAAAGAAGMGVSLGLIHMYVTELKRLLQAFLALGTAGGVYLAATHDASLPEYVLQHRSAVWLVGPAFAALTGVAFKEGVCYGKAEAFALTLLIPVLLLGHLSGLAPDMVEHGLAVAAAALLLVFAARKYTQPVKDDIGDGSVFLFKAMPPEEQAKKIRQLRADGEIMQ